MFIEIETDNESIQLINTDYIMSLNRSHIIMRDRVIDITLEDYETIVGILAPCTVKVLHGTLNGSSVTYAG